MGVFFVAEANRKIRTLELKAYDAMLNLLSGNLSEEQTAFEMEETKAELAAENAMMDEINRIEACDDINQILEGNSEV